MPEISPLQYDYLAEIYRLREAHTPPLEYVPTAELAASLMLMQSTVNRVIERLRRLELVEHRPYTGVTLTSAGERAAHHILRKQRIVEAFLVQVMGFGWHEVYEEARRLRHGVGEPLLARMWQMAGEPPTSPFGEPITAPDEPAHPPADSPLSETPIQRTYRIARVMTRVPDRLEYIAALGLQPRSSLKLIHRAPFNGPLQLQLNGEYRIVGHELAQIIRVVPEDAAG